MRFNTSLHLSHTYARKLRELHERGRGVQSAAVCLHKALFYFIQNIFGNPVDKKIFVNDMTRGNDVYLDNYIGHNFFYISQ